MMLNSLVNVLANRFLTCSPNQTPQQSLSQPMIICMKYPALL